MPRLAALLAIGDTYREPEPCIIGTVREPDPVCEGV